jgi:hypothetical protein
MRIRDGDSSDPGSGMEKSRIRDKHPGIRNTGSDFVKVLVPVPDPDNIYHSFPTTKNLYKILPFQCQNRHFSQEVGLSILFINCFIPFYFGSTYKSDSGSAKARSYGSGSTTPILSQRC